MKVSIETVIDGVSIKGITETQEKSLTEFIMKAFQDFEDIILIGTESTVFSIPVDKLKNAVIIYTIN